MKMIFQTGFEDVDGEVVGGEVSVATTKARSIP